MPEQSFKNLNQAVSLPFPISFRVKANIYPEVNKTLCDLATSLPSSYTTIHSEAHSAPAASSLLPLDKSEMLLPQGFSFIVVSVWNALPQDNIHYALSFPLGLCANVTFSMKPSLTGLFKLLSTPTINFLSLLRLYLFVFTALNHHLIILPIYLLTNSLYSSSSDRHTITYRDLWGSGPLSILFSAYSKEIHSSNNKYWRLIHKLNDNETLLLTYAKSEKCNSINKWWG